MRHEHTRHEAELHGLTGHGISPRDHRLRGNDRRAGGQNDQREAQRFRRAYAQVLGRPAPEDPRISDLGATGVFDSRFVDRLVNPAAATPMRR